MLFLVIVSLLAIYVGRFYWKVSKYSKGPFPLPVIGNMHQITASKIYLDIARFKKQYGDTVTIWFSSKPVVFLTSYETVKEAFLTKGDFLIDRPQDFFTNVTMSIENGGVVFANGDSWRELRRISLQILRDFGLGKNIMEQMIHEQVLAVIAHFEKDVDKNAVDFEPIVLHMIGNIINQLLYGFAHPYGKTNILTELNENVVGILVKMTETIWPRASDALPIIKSLPYIGRKAFTEMKELSNDNIRIAKINVKKALENYSTEDEPNCYVQAYKQQINKSPYLTEDNLYNVCNDFFVAGTDTTMTTIKWIIIYMTKYPDIQEKVRLEISAVVGFDRLPSLEDKCKMPYTQAVIYEIQRHANMFPTLLERISVEDVTINGHTFPKGTSFMPATYEIFSDEKNWPNPEEFDPSRFLNENGSAVNQDAANKIIVFGMGKRACVGEGLARAETFIFTTALLQKYKFLPPLTGLDMGRIEGFSHHAKKNLLRIRDVDKSIYQH